jgi:glycosyltransferase involved in cell wall biosynthesis
MTSLWEGLPRALVEALALEKPSVCYDTDGVRDILGAEDGSLVSRHDTSRLAEKVVSLLSNNALYAKVASQSAQRIGRDFDIDEMVIQQERLYDSL